MYILLLSGQTNRKIDNTRQLQTMHYDDVIMSTMASQITSLTIVYLTIYSGADQSKHQSSASLAFVWGIHRGPVNSPHKWPVTRKMFPFDDVIMFYTLSQPYSHHITITSNEHRVMTSHITDYSIVWSPMDSPHKVRVIWNFGLLSERKIKVPYHSHFERRIHRLTVISSRKEPSWGCVTVWNSNWVPLAWWRHGLFSA